MAPFQFLWITFQLRWHNYSIPVPPLLSSYIIIRLVDDAIENEFENKKKNEKLTELSTFAIETNGDFCIDSNVNREQRLCV